MTRFLAPLARATRRHGFALSVVACAAAACAFPGLFDEWRGVPLSRFVAPSIQLIMFGMGATLRPSDFASIAKAPWSVAVGALLQFAVMPVAGFAVARLFGFEGELAAGMVLIGSVSGGMASNIIAYLAGANVALSVTMTCVSTLLSPLLTPALMKLFADAYVTVDAAKMMASMVEIVIAPVAAGLVLRLALGRFYDRHKAAIDRVLTTVASFGVCFSIAVCLAPNSALLVKSGVVILLSSVVHSTIGFALGYWLARLAGLFLPIDERDAKTVSIEVGMQNGGMAAALAVNVLGSTVAALPANAAAVWMNVAGSLLASRWRGANAPAATE
ncbi:MAG: bile acid:sodium symporter family protein [Kiritimatiellae bacterium]|nr:bile acid:sodium symporter family protein [Kiritimatiellia bacterium]